MATLRDKQDTWVRMLLDTFPVYRDKKRFRVSHHEHDTWHFWPCEGAGPEHQGTYWTRGILPNEVVFDLDISDWKQVKKAYETIQKVLDGLGFPYLLAYTGGKSCHLQVFLDNTEDIWTAEELADFDEHHTDFWRLVREAFTTIILEMGDLKSYVIKLDWKKIRWAITKKGSMIRDFGTPRPDGQYKSMISTIPDERPTIKEPIFPSAVPIAKVWAGDFGRKLHDRTLAQHKQLVAAEVKEQEVLSGITLPKLDILEWPCIKERMESRTPPTLRYTWAITIALAARDNGASDEDIRKIVSDFMPTCEGWDSDPKLRTYPNDALRYAKAGKHFSCAFVRDELCACDDERRKICPRWTSIIHISQQYRQPSEYFYEEVVHQGKENERKTIHFEHGLFADDLIAIERFRKAYARGGKLYYYSDGIYLPKGEAYIDRVIKQVLGKMVKHVGKKALAEVVHQVSMRCGILEEEPKDDIEQIPFNNGVYNWRTGKWRPFDRDVDIFYGKPPHDYLENGGDWNKIGQFFKDIVGGDWPTRLERWFASCLIRRPIKDANLFLNAPTDSAKTTFGEFVEMVFGKALISHVPLQCMDYDRHRFSTIKLKDVYVNWADDLEANRAIEVGLFKWITGGASFEGEFKGKDREKIEAYCQHIFASNSPPDIADDSDAYDVRVQQITFPYKFVNAPDPTDRMQKQKVEMVKLLESLNKQIPAFLSHVAKLVPDVFQNGLGSALTTDENKLMRLKASNPVKAFFQESVEWVELDQTLKVDTWEDIKSWITDQGLSMFVGKKELTKHYLGSHLQSWFPRISEGIATVKRDDKDRKLDVWIGFKIKKDYRSPAHINDPPPRVRSSPKLTIDHFLPPES